MELSLPDWFSILPPLLAIVVALIFRTVVPALFLGIWLGAWGLAGLDLPGLGESLLASLTVHVRDALADPDHAAIILFSCMIGGLIGIIQRGGAMRSIVNWITGRVTTPRQGQLATAGLGLGLFIDDYANSLVVGQTMRPVADRIGISRAKLAYLVDSTAAPVTAVALISTWIGYQVGLLDEAAAHIEGLDRSGYGLFLSSVLYSFYPWLCLLLVFLVARSGLDIGPMRQAEAAARQSTDALAPASPEALAGAPLINAWLPLLVLVLGVIVGLYVTGEGDSLQAVFGSASPYMALMWASLVAVLVALALPLAQRRMNLAELMDGWVEGVHHMILAMIILILAWALAGITKQLGTADYLVSLLGDALPAALLPALIFLIAAATAFATGTSWGTMGILVPLVVPLAWHLAPETAAILHASIAAVLAGAVWGDHCSPISDTTILSSMACECDHVEHVRTQLPYALLAGAAALLLGYLPVGFGLPWWAALLLGGAMVALILRILGRRVAAT